MFLSIVLHFLVKIRLRLRDSAAYIGTEVTRLVNTYAEAHVRQ